MASCPRGGKIAHCPILQGKDVSKCYRIEIKYVDEKEKKKGRKNGTRYILRLHLSLFRRSSCWKERKKTINVDTTLIISIHEDQPVHDLVLSKKICAFYKNSSFYTGVEIWGRWYSQGIMHLPSAEESASFNQSEVGQCRNAGEDSNVSFTPISQAVHFADWSLNCLLLPE